MSRTKWMRLVVRDLADVLRWANQQDAQRIDDFRYRIVAGREIVSFRLFPRYPIEIGTRDIVVVAHVRPSPRQALARRVSAAGHRIARAIARRLATGALPSAPPIAGRTAELRRLPSARLPRPSRS